LTPGSEAGTSSAGWKEQAGPELDPDDDAKILTFPAEKIVTASDWLIGGVEPSDKLILVCAVSCL
jgi:hypothetical protein